VPSLLLNRRIWDRYDWSQGGEEWSKNWGGTFHLWHGILMPRIGQFLGDVRAMEIAPGYGRLTAYLKNYVSSLTLVDLTPQCIRACEQRFDADTHLQFFVNDGRSLSFAADNSIDFVFSFDSLVHADMAVMGAYLEEIERVLAIGGWAVLHHSNLAAELERVSGTTGPFSHRLRARDVSADRIAEAAAKTDTLHCAAQELLCWDDSSLLRDCISTFTREERSERKPVQRLVNRDFYRHACELRACAEFYRLR
jgi:SAM-dependent methyltransferase